MKTTLRLTVLSLVILGLRLPIGAQEPTQPKAQEPTPPSAQEPTPPTAPEPAAPKTFTAERLEQMAAPIALYPDPLVAQILMASTYPLEVVEASRWVEKNPELKGAALEEALKQNEWDPSVKALCGFPTVLKKMNDNLAWTRDLGDAFLAQKTELMDTIQTMRRKALDAGTLKTTEQQQVSQDDGKIVVQPANPEVIYVPTYSPAVVYGPSWYYPSWYYPGWYDPWPWAFVSFGIGFWWGSACWGSCDWHHHCCNVNCHQFNTFNGHTSAHPAPMNSPSTGGTTATWQHNPAHRAGVNYRSPQVAHSFGAAPGSTRVMSTAVRGVAPATSMTGTRGSPSGPGTRAGFGPSPVASHGSMPSLNRGGTTPITQGTTPITRGAGMGPGSGRGATAQIGSLGHSAAPLASAANGRSWSAPSYRSAPRSYSAAPSSSRGSAGMNSYRSSSWSHSSSGWGGASHGSSTTFGGGWRGVGGWSGGSGWHGGGSFGGGHSSGGFGGRGFGGGGFHGGGHR